MEGTQTEQFTLAGDAGDLPPDPKNTSKKAETARYSITKEGHLGHIIERDQEALQLEFERYRELNKQINTKLDQIFAENKLPFSGTRSPDSFMRISFLVGPEMVKSQEEKNSKNRWQVDDDQYAFMLHILANGRAQLVRAKANPLSPIFNDESSSPGPASENFLYHVQQKLADLKDYLAHFAKNGDYDGIAEIVGNTVTTEYKTWKMIDVAEIYESIEHIDTLGDGKKVFESVLELGIGSRKPMFENALKHFVKYSLKACQTETDINNLNIFLEQNNYNRHTGTKLALNQDYLKQQTKLRSKEIKQNKKQHEAIQDVRKQIEEIGG